MNLNVILTSLIIVPLLLSCNTNIFDNKTTLEPTNCDSLTKDIYRNYEAVIVNLVDNNKKDTLNMKYVDSLICLMDSSCKYYPQMVVLKYKLSIELNNFSSGISYLENVPNKYFGHVFDKKLSINHLRLLSLLEKSDYREFNELRNQTQQYLVKFISTKDSLLVNCYIDDLNTIDLNISQVNNLLYNLKNDKGEFSREMYDAKIENYHNIINEKKKNTLVKNRSFSNNKIKTKQTQTLNDIEQF